MMDMFIARQPIFDENKQIYGYELSFREDPRLEFPNGESQNLDPDGILNDRPVLINFTDEMIARKLPLRFPKDRVIIGSREGMQPGDNILSSLSMLYDQGYTIAWDHPESGQIPGMLKKKGNIIRFNLRSFSINLLLEAIAAVNSESGIRLMAENIEIYDDFRIAKSLGFTLFRGFFFSTPENLFSKRVAPNKLATLNLISEMRQKELDYHRIETFIKSDAPLSFKLLRYINSAYFKRRVTINTIKDAIAYLGEDELRRFIHIVAVSTIGEDKPDELVRMSITRAGMCERCATVFKLSFSRDEMFMLGLFSLMDALMDCRMRDILAHINFSDEMRSALLGKDRHFKMLLDIIAGFERGRRDHSILKKIADPAVEEKLRRYYLASLKSANAFYDK
ncbi:MAG TPA: signal transduction protein [Desulfobacteraceae bacterium]|nr:signal transduction protein [Desulfobacteraceae bacterium]